MSTNLKFLDPNLKLIPNPNPILRSGSISTNLEYFEEELNTGLGWVGGGGCRYIIMPPCGPTSKIARN